MGEKILRSAHDATKSGICMQNNEKNSYPYIKFYLKWVIDIYKFWKKVLEKKVFQFQFG